MSTALSLSDGPILGDFGAVGDELHAGADGVDVGLILRGLGLVHLDAPVDAGQRQPVVDVAHVGARRQQRGDLLGGGGQQLGIERRELDLHRLAGRRAGARRGHLDQDARNVRGLLADRVHDLVRRRAGLPVGELELDHADRVLADLVGLARLFARAGVDRLQAGELQHAVLDGAHQTVLLVEREVAAAMDHDLAVVGLDLGEELDAASELAVGHLHADQQQQRQQQRHAGMAQRQLHRAHIETAILGALVMRHRARRGRAARRASA